MKRRERKEGRKGEGPLNIPDVRAYESLRPLEHMLNSFDVHGDVSAVSNTVSSLLITEIGSMTRPVIQRRTTQFKKALLEGAQLRM